MSFMQESYRSDLNNNEWVSVKSPIGSKRTRKKSFKQNLASSSGSDNDESFTLNSIDTPKPALIPLSYIKRFYKKKSDRKGSLPVQHDEQDSDDNVLINTSTPESNGLVLIKYKKTVDKDSGLESLKTSQLQKKREVYSLLLFIFFLFVTIITLSQILVMHNQTQNSNFYQIKLMQEELKLMDTSIDRMLKEKHVIPIQLW